jgi:hypothetical protein
MKNNQQGIAVLALIASIVLIGLIVFSGYVVINKQSNKTAKSSSLATTQNLHKKSGSQQNEAKQTDTTENTDFLFIKEAGIKIPLTANTKDAYYVISPQDSAGKPPSVKLSVHSLDGYPNCKATTDQGGIAGIFTFKEGDSNEVMGDIHTMYRQAPKIGDYYYAIDASQYDCTDGKNTELYSKAKHELADQYSNIQKL